MNQFIILITVCLMLYMRPCSGQAGILDPSFGSVGYVTTFIGANTYIGRMLLQPDGKIVVISFSGLYSYYAPWLHSGITTLARYNTDGTLDQDFGIGGRIEYTNDTISIYYNISAALQADGKILWAGSVLNSDTNDNFAFALWRYDSNGSLDTTFGDNGRVVTHSPYNSLSVNIFVLPDSSIRQCGGAINNTLVFAKYHPDGTSDTSYGTGGILRSFPVNNAYNNTPVIKLLSNGKLLVEQNFSNIFRCNADGSADTTFRTFSQNANEFYYAMAVENDGSIILGADSADLYSNILSGQCAVIKLNPNGDLDTTFNHSGIVYFGVHTKNYISDITAQSDDKILALINSSDSGFASFISVVRFLANGRIDSSFGTNGVFSLDTNLIANSNGSSISIQPDNKVLIYGFADNSSFTQSSLLVLRLLTDLNLGIIDKGSSSATTEVYPNPIHQQATISYELSKDEVISIGLYDTGGRMVQTISGSEYICAGSHKQTITINADIPTGSYILRIGGESEYSNVRVTVK